MDFEVTVEQAQMQETARRIAVEFGLEYWRRLDAAHEFPLEMWRALCSAGIAGASLPVEAGGSGSMLDLVLMLEALTENGAGLPLAQLFMLNPVFGGRAVSAFGTDAMRRDLLSGLADGSVLMSFALTEPNSGNNALDIRTRAMPHGDGWRLSGQKVWISGFDMATHLLIVARTSSPGPEARKSDGISMFLIDARRAGIKAARIAKAGTHPVSAFTLFLDEVEVRPDECIGTLDRAWSELLQLLNAERIVTAAGLVGTGRLAVSLACAYVRERRIFGAKAIGSYQGVQFPLARSAAELDGARLMNRQAAWLMDAGKPFGREANAAKFLAAEAACAACDRAMQVMGGMGYAAEFHVERLWRDARVFAIAPVPQELILSFIAVHELGLPRSH
ncbi:acyl-CoA dehydrogenase family protein [Xanthobacter flavus]|uniref:acyl-CoA dehydrogenase family protein n=1 Tax=Xanthobacter flavus TaxID=281 RepID=UPI00372914EC